MSCLHRFVLVVIVTCYLLYNCVDCWQRRAWKPCVAGRRFEAERALQLVPPDGEFAVMNYRSTYPFKPPFRVTCSVDDDPNSALKVAPYPWLRASHALLYTILWAMVLLPLLGGNWMPM